MTPEEILSKHGMASRECQLMACIERIWPELSIQTCISSIKDWMKCWYTVKYHPTYPDQLAGTP